MLKAFQLASRTGSSVRSFSSIASTDVKESRGDNSLVEAFQAQAAHHKIKQALAPDEITRAFHKREAAYVDRKLAEIERNASKAKP